MNAGGMRKAKRQPGTGCLASALSRPVHSPTSERPCFLNFILPAPRARIISLTVWTEEAQSIPIRFEPFKESL
jgi:hypothetical protein